MACRILAVTGVTVTSKNRRSTACILIGDGATRILVDMGYNLLRQSEKYSIRQLDAVLFTHTNGVLDKNKQFISTLSTDEVEGLVANGTVKGGMFTKLRVASECAGKMLSGGVVILNGNYRFSILKEILSEKATSTLVRLVNPHFRVRVLSESSGRDVV